MLIRYANRVPLQFQPGVCLITQTVMGMNWRAYGLNQVRNKSGFLRSRGGIVAFEMVGRYMENGNDRRIRAEMRRFRQFVFCSNRPTPASLADKTYFADRIGRGVPYFT